MRIAGEQCPVLRRAAAPSAACSAAPGRADPTPCREHLGLPIDQPPDRVVLPGDEDDERGIRPSSHMLERAEGRLDQLPRAPVGRETVLEDLDARIVHVGREPGDAIVVRHEDERLRARGQDGADESLHLRPVLVGEHDVCRADRAGSGSLACLVSIHGESLRGAPAAVDRITRYRRRNGRPWATHRS